ncbi:MULTISPECIES: NUDIX hydrolase [Paenibacillus]|jgi:ADP-ribose pyrophosphatase YjhB (NUDIX family)|uniref:NUDIX hydrolase n=1 Tax=Paenibacillus TaxID=44249 RepID=UPI00300A28AF
MKSFNHFGVYGICQRDGKLLVIHKGRGPYTGRYDLPGGRLEENESLLDGLVREFMEETGFAVKAERNLGIFDFFVRYQEEDFTHMHHLAALYQVELDGEQEPAAISAFAEQDSSGMEWVELARITLDSASPGAVLAAKWLSGDELTMRTEYYDFWEIKTL